MNEKNNIIIFGIILFLVSLSGGYFAITNYYNNTTQSHSSLLNLSYATSGHTGFVSSVTLGLVEDDIDTLFLQNSLQDDNINLKVNKSGDNMTGMLNVSLSNPSNSYGIGVVSDGYFYASNNTSPKTFLSSTGKQWWSIGATTTGLHVGYISYGSPGGYPGISYYSSNYPNSPYYRTDVSMTARGLETYTKLYINGSASNTNSTLIDWNGNYTITSLSGVGNRNLCVNASGTIIICP